MTFQTIAWNGICFDAPAPWQVDRLDARYLLLESDGHPVMEVRWEPVRGKVKPGSYLAKLNAARGKKPTARISPTTVPADWAACLSGFETAGFRWTGASMSGSGVILYCPDCRNLSLLQFYDNAFSPGAAAREIILRSFHDHPIDGFLDWSMFGMRLRTAADFRLVRHQFEPGYAALVFQSRGERLSLLRWGPAGILLKQRSLSDFVQTLPLFSNHHWSFSDSGGDTEIMGSNWPVRRGWGYYGLRFRPGFSFRQFRLWLDREKNRVLGNLLETRKPYVRESVRDMINSYETV